MPYLDNGIPYKILYASFVSKILYIARAAKDLHKNKKAMEKQGSNVYVPFHFGKKIFGKQFKVYFIKLQIALMNLLSFSLCN